MDKEIFISYIIPCYNVEKYLPKCMESLSRQRIDSGAGIEYIFVNDGSTDGCLDLLKAFAAKDARAQVIDQKNQGVSAARNHGLKMATGKYIFFLDGDDFLTDEASQLVYDVYLEDEVDIIIPYAYEIRDKFGKKIWKPFPAKEEGIYYVKKYVKISHQLPVSVKVYKKETLLKNGIYFDEDLKVGEVYSFFIHVLAYSEKVALTTKLMMNWVIREDGTSFGSKIERDGQIINTMHRIDEYAGSFEFDIRKLESYNVTLYKIANCFGVDKYLCKNEITEHTIPFLCEIINDKVYRNNLKSIVFGGPKVNGSFNEALIEYIFPAKLSLKLLKFKREQMHKLRMLFQRSHHKGN